MKQTFFKTFALAVAIFATPAVAMAAITEWGNSETTSWTAPTSSKYDHGSTVTLSGVVITLGTTVDTGIQWEGKAGSNQGIVPGNMPNTDGTSSTLITSFDDKAPYGTLPTRGGFLKIVPSEDGRITINGLPSSQKSQKLVFVTCNKDDSSIESVSLDTYSSEITSWNYSVDASHVYYFFQLAYSGQLAGYRFTLRGLSFRPSMSAAKSALADALDAAKAKLDSYANCTGEGPFMVTTASYSSLNSAYTTAKAAYDKDDYEDLDAADAAYAAQTTALNSVALVLNQPDANKCYYIKYGTLYLNLNSDTKWDAATNYMPVLSSQPYALKFEAKEDTENGYYIKDASGMVYIYHQIYSGGNSYPTAIGYKNSAHFFLPDPVSGGQIKFKSSWKDDYYFAGSNPSAGSVLGVSNSNIRSFTVTEATELNATASVTSALWGTFVAPFDVDFTETGITAYTVALNDGKDAIVTTKVEDGAVAANTPVLIHASSATSHVFTDYSSAYYTGQPTVGALTGTLASETSAPAGSYLLQKQGEDVGFYYLSAAAAINQYRAWLTVPDAGVKAFVLNDQLTDAINAIVSQGDSTAEYFSVGGTRLSQPTRGINIVRTVDGKTKKIVVK